MLRSKWYESIASDFINMFPVSYGNLRTVGREAEYPVVDHDGFGVDVSVVLMRMLDVYDEYIPVFKDGCLAGIRSHDHSFFLEVGKGTVEIVTEPRRSLWDIKTIHRKAMQRLSRAADEGGCAVLGFGLQPRTASSYDFLTKKPHYKALYSIIPSVWD
jgi:gamma-glutamylcysteine synthetase